MLYFKMVKMYNYHSHLGLFTSRIGCHLSPWCNDSTSIRHLPLLLTGFYKGTVTTDPRFMQSFSEKKNPLYNLRKSTVFFVPPARLITHGTNSMHIRGTLICNQLLTSIKSSKSIAQCKIKLKQLGNIGSGKVTSRR